MRAGALIGKLETRQPALSKNGGCFVLDRGVTPAHVAIASILD